MSSNRCSRLIVVSIFWGSLVLAGCGGGGDGQPVAEPPPTTQPPPSAPPPSPPSASPKDIATSISTIKVADATAFVVTQGPALSSSTGSAKGLTILAPIAAKPDSASMGWSSSTGSESFELFKVTADGTVEAVGFYDSEGSEIDRGLLRPQRVWEVGPDFLVMLLSIEGENFELLVEKQTGRAYLTEHFFNTQFALDYAFTREYQPRFNADNKMYLVQIGSGSLVEVDLSQTGQAEVAARVIDSIEIDLLQDFELSKSDDILIYVGSNKSTHNWVHRILDLRDNSLRNVSSLGVQFGGHHTPPLLRGLDGHLYTVSSEAVSPVDQFTRHNYVLMSIGRDDDGSIVANEVSGLAAESASGLLEDREMLRIFNQSWFHHSNFRHVVAGRLFFTEEDNVYPYARLFELDIPNSKIIHHDTPFYRLRQDDALDRYFSDKYIWLSGTSDHTGLSLVLRYDPVSREYIELQVDSDLDLISIQALTNDRILFTATRLSDQAKIVGEMGLDGTTVFTNVYESIQSPVVYFRTVQPADFLRVDGNPNDWSTGYRSLFSPRDSGPVGDDLLYYSELAGDEEYFGLIEFKETPNTQSTTRVYLHPHILTLGSGWATLANTISDESVDLFEVGGRVAIGSAIEFAIPLTEFMQAPFAQQVQRSQTKLYGAVEEIVYGMDPSDSGQYLIRIQLESALGPAVLQVKMTNDQELNVDMENATIISSDGNVRHVVNDMAGNVEYSNVDSAGGVIRIMIPVDSIDVDNVIMEVISSPLLHEVIVDSTT